MLLKPLLNAIGAGTPRPWLPDQLFRGGEVGVWYDPSDLSTLFQDAAGTTPVTGVEQPVGLMLDKSGNGFDATQSTAAARPVLSSRYNRLLKTEQFDDAAWVTAGATVTPNATTSPIGDLTADQITTPAGVNRPEQLSLEGGNSKSFTGSIYIRGSVGGERVRLNVFQNMIANNLSGEFVLTTEWVRIEHTAVATASSNRMGIALWNTSGIEQTVFVWGADLRESQYDNLPYQRVNTATEYDFDFSKFPPYLLDDKVDDQMTVTLPAIPTATVVEATDDGVSITYPVNIPAGAYVLDTTSTLGRDYGRVIIDRELTAAEQFRLQTYLDIKRGAA